MSLEISGRIKRAYRAVTPLWLRRTRFVEMLKRVWIACLPHNAVYDTDYYQNAVEDAAAISAESIAESLCRDLRPGAVLDVGCGSGTLLDSLKRRDLIVRGLELSEAALEICASRGLDVTRFDLEKDTFEPQQRFDVVVSMEVAEHLPARCARRYVELLSRVASHVVFTAAPPGQGGTDHVNEQPRSYWIAMFEEMGFGLRPDLENAWREEWRRKGVAAWYWMNLMVFEGPEHGCTENGMNGQRVGD